MINRFCICVILFSISTGALSEDLIPIIPVVNAEKAKANLKPKPENNEDAAAAIEPYRYEPKPNTASGNKSKITMSQGVTEILQIAVGHLNRIVTPYESPVVTSSSPATTEVRDNVVYIGTSSESPLTLFITEKGSEEQALSLTLIPKKVPPREITIAVSGSSGSSLRGTKKAEKWEKLQPYISTIQGLFKAIALGDIPSGYALSKEKKIDGNMCRQTGLNFDFESGQVLNGHNLMVIVGVATNDSVESIEFIEDTCGAWNVAAVAAFPKTVLLPGERTEVYVALKKHYIKQIKQQRPSLLRGGLRNE